MSFTLISLATHMQFSAQKMLLVIVSYEKNDEKEQFSCLLCIPVPVKPHSD